MKALKVLLGIVAVVVAIVAIVMVLVLKNLDEIIKTVVETVGSDVTQVSVTLDSVNAEISKGRIELHGLSIDNPKGFDGDYLFDMSQVAVQVDPNSLAGDVIVINEILVDAAKISAELKGSNTNLQALQKNISQSVASGADSSSDSKKAPAAESTTSSEGADVRLAIEKFSFVNSNLQLATDQWGDRTVQMPNIVMKNLGSKSAGLTPEELSQEIIARISKAAQKAIESEVKDLAKEKAEEKLNEELDARLSDKEKDQLNQLKGLFGK